MLQHATRNVYPEVRSHDFGVRKILFVTNEGDGDIYFNFNLMEDEADGILLKSGETVGPFDLSVNKVFYAGTGVIRYAGVKKGAY